MTLTPGTVFKKHYFLLGNEPNELECFFVQLGFNLSDKVTDTLESSSKLIYLVQMKSIYTQISGRKPS